MTNGIKYRSLVVAVLCCMLWAACTQERQECLAVTTASLSMRCMHKQTDTSTVFADTALPASLLVAFTDSAKYTFKYRTPQSIFALSLSTVTDSCRWGFTTDTTGAVMDTLTFYYKRNQKFISNACGYTYFYTLTGAKTTTGVMIDSVRVTDNSVTNDVNKRHVQVFIHPSF